MTDFICIVCIVVFFAVFVPTFLWLDKKACEELFSWRLRYYEDNPVFKEVKEHKDDR